MKLKEIDNLKRRSKQRQGLNALLAGLISASLLLGTSCGRKTETPEPSKSVPAVSAAPSPSATPSSTPAPTAKPRELSPFSGSELPAAIRNRRPLCIMIDNHEAARPQAGLNAADLVFEMPVEGGISRYMAVFQSREPERVGPVRSARDCFLDRMLELQGIYVHFGGSYPALDRIATEAYETLDGLVYCGDGSAIYRDDSTGKWAPHNAYADPARLRELADSLGYAPERAAGAPGYRFRESAETPKGQSAETIRLSFSDANETSFSYVKDEGLYHIYKDGEEQADEDSGEAMVCRNVVIQFVPVSLYDPPLLLVEQSGEGEGWYASMGRIQPIRWKKSGERDLTRYYDAKGDEILLNPGQTRIEVLAPDRDVSYD